MSLMMNETCETVWRSVSGGATAGGEGGLSLAVFVVARGDKEKIKKDHPIGLILFKFQVASPTGFEPVSPA